MKFEPLFKSENNKLIKISDNSSYPTVLTELASAESGEQKESKESAKNLNIVDLDFISGNSDFSDISESDIFPENKNQISAVKVQWEKIDFGGENYNEEILAALRSYLKKLEENGRFAFIIPSTEKEISDSDLADSYIKAMVHSARRIKDCTSVVGFAVPDEFLKKDSDSKVSILDENSYSQWFVNEMNVKHGHYIYFVNSDKIQQAKSNADFSKSRFVLYKM